MISLLWRIFISIFIILVAFSLTDVDLVYKYYSETSKSQFLFRQKTAKNINEPRGNFSIRTYIRRNSVWTEIRCRRQWYKKRRTLFVRTLHKILFFRKRKKPMKYNVVRTIIFRSSLQETFIFLDCLSE